MLPPFLDSTNVADDGPELGRRLERDGYLFVRGLLPRADVLDLQRQFLEHADRGGWLDRSYPRERGIADIRRACKDPEPAYLEVFKPMWTLEALHRLKHHRNVIALFERIFGEPALVHPLLVARNIFPQTETFDFTTSAHQDKVHLGGGTSYATWIPLGDCPLAKGGLTVAAGSHKQGVMPFDLAPGAGGIVVRDPLQGRWVASDFAVGDAVIFCDTLVHKALPNRSRELRQSFDSRYQRLSDPISDLSCGTYANMWSWDEVYRSWRNDDLKYYWLKQGAKIVPYDTRYYELRDKTAFDLAERGDRLARDTLLRIVQRDTDPAKRSRARALLDSLDRGIQAGAG
jgi:Phytanoyl-CoA dioxygenase (PhyH)